MPMEAAKSELSTPRPVNRRRWVRKLLWIVVILVALVVVGGFVVTSSAFFKAVVLPRAGAAMNAEITVTDASIRPFSQLILRDLQVTPRGQETLLSAREVRLLYDPLAILRGNLVVTEFGVDSPVLQVIQNADGTSNLDPLLASQPTAQESKPTAEPAGETEPRRIEVKKLSVTGATLRFVRHYSPDQKDLSELTAGRLLLENLKNDGAGRLELGGVVEVDHNPPAPGTRAALQAAIAGQFRFELSPALQPRLVQGDASLQVQQAAGALDELAGLLLRLTCEWSPAEIRGIALHLERAGAELAAMTLSGPFDAAKGEGRLGVDLRGVDRQCLNLVGAPWGLQFNNTTLASTNQIELAGTDGPVRASGRFDTSRFSITQAGQTTPELDFAGAYDVVWDRNILDLKTARLSLTPTARARNQVDLTGRLDLARRDALTGALRLSAESFDLTPLHDLFAQQGLAASSAAPVTRGSPSQPEAEPDAMRFPVQDLTCDVEIGKVWLREIEITTCLARLEVDGGRIVLDPFQLKLNGAPVEGRLDLNLGVPGFAYDLSLSADRVPVEPLANSLMPEYRGMAKGDLIARIQTKGAGTTDAKLQQNLSGRNSLVFTNAVIQTVVLTNLFASMERSPNLLVRTAGHVFKPTSIPFKILSPVLTSLSSKLALGDLSALPLNAIDAHATLGGGNIQTSCNLWSPAFTLTAGGDVVMDTILTNSPIRNWPVNLSLARSLAQRIPYLTSAAPTNTPYVALPSLFRVGGTLGLPTTTFDTARFTEWTAQNLLQGRSIGGVDAGNVARRLTDLLEGRKPSETPEAGQPAGATSTNAPASPVNQLLDLLKRPPTD